MLKVLYGTIGSSVAGVPGTSPTLHILHVISSLVTTPRPKMGLSDKGDMQHVQLGRLQERVWEPLLYGIVKMP